ncbi:MAG TPA: energy transducer TonB [Allosphingosinicella sp.]|jgi:TonB family protein|nr:energy transducer TonB [Allosphingosinicella sp.]
MTTAAIALGLLVAAPASPAESDDQVWALARKVDKAPAYETYLLRFPAGRHGDQAFRAYHRARNLPVPKKPWYHPWSHPSGVIVRPPAGGPDTCGPLVTAQVLKTSDSEEGRDYLAVLLANRPSAFRAYLEKYPKGACAAELSYRLRVRQEQSGRFKPIARFGPLAPHPLMREFYTVEDYPARARRNRESGRAVAAFEVAEDGFVEGCRIVQSSGSEALDEASCRLLARRMRYDPARDRAGAPVRTAASHVFDWVLPAD